MTTTERALDINGIETVALKDFFPKKETRYEKDVLPVPYMELAGEFSIYIGPVSNGIIVLSNYRLFVQEEKSFFNVPIGLIESIDNRDLFTLIFLCKDARTYRCTFATNEKCLEWGRRLLDAIKIRNLTETFAFSFYAWSYDEIIQSYSPNSSLSKQLRILDLRENSSSHWFDQEVSRLDFDLNQDNKAWRICSANNNYKLCETYPRQHVVPMSITDDDIAKICEFRACNRFPSIVWRDKNTGLVLGRSSQPNVGLFWWRNTNDEAFIRAMAISAQLNPGIESMQTCDQNEQCQIESDKNVLIIDARSYAAAMANRAKGGGSECEEYYTSSIIRFMNLPNIHVVRKSFIALRQLCSVTDENWLTALDGTKWLTFISSLLRSALIVVDAICIEKKSVLVHCSDGWDRTPQITALAQILLDPFYRTLQGFQILVDREWIDFGHKFADRCGQGVATSDPNERCPIFIQWIDSMHQLLQQFPTAFQFNHCFLAKLAQHAYSCLFGDFLFNSDKQRSQYNMRSRTMSIWSWLLNSQDFRNHLYLPTRQQQVLRPAYNVQDLHFWSSLYKAPLPSTKLSTTVPIIDTNDTMDAGISSDISSKSSKVSTDDDEDMLPRSTPTSDIGSDSITLPHNFESNLSRFKDEDPMALQRIRHRSGAIVPMISDDECKRRASSLDRATEYACSIESSITTLHSLSLETMDSIDMTKNNGILNDSKNLHPNDDYLRSDSPNISCIAKNINCDLNEIFKFQNLNDNLECKGQYYNTNESLDNPNINTVFTVPKQEKSEVEAKDNVNAQNLEPIINRTKLENLLEKQHSNNVDNNFQLHQPRPKKSISQDYSNMALNIDFDGLTSFFDPIQSCVLDIRLQYERRIKQLESQLKQNKCNCNTQQMNGRGSDAKDETSSNDSGEPSNVSDGSWEQLPEPQEELTRWIPDYIATHCFGCEKEFWTGLRKHHCRSCGRVFCHECTKYSMPCPAQHLIEPARVCKRCYEAP